MSIRAIARDGHEIERGRITKLLAFRGLKRTGVDEALAGDIVAVAGLSKATVADTLAAPEVAEALPAQPIDPPTIAITVSINDSPLAGRDGDKVQSRVIRARLLARGARPTSPSASPRPPTRTPIEVAGRGELQLGVLIETMRREGFELSISRPRVVYQTRPGERRAPGADRGSDHRRRRRLRRRRHREAGGAQGRAHRHGPLRRRQDPAGVPWPRRGR